MDSITTTEILAVRKYGEILGKPSHFVRYEKVFQGNVDCLKVNSFKQYMKHTIKSSDAIDRAQYIGKGNSPLHIATN